MINYFAGEYKASIDEKGRISIPARFRKWETGDSEPVFVLTKGFDPCIVAYPSVEWDSFAEKMLKLPKSNKKYRAFVRNICRSAVRLKCDKQGRIVIPQSLLEYANIAKEAIIIGVLNSIEIWNPETLNNYEESGIKLDDEYFQDLENLL
ncbi:MAG: division/cell wall cluster transcriptional repressor MraZ [Candidatus Marinimicrobia bacterium]|nr:division/cell wall cluster transcriptional repressor MraZ [Candidatus Neomarinimicrobiota bacterium]